MNITAPKDAAEAHRSYGADGFRENVRTQQRPFEPVGPTQNEKRALPPIVDIMDFLGTPLPKPPELIKGILHKGSKLILSGASKSRKTWSLAHLALCVATGQAWWGCDTTPGKVLYANFELGAPYFQERLLAIKEKLVIDGASLQGQLQIWNLRGHAKDLAELAEEVIQQANRQYDLIILDPIYKVLGERDENSNGQMADLMNVIDRIIDATGAAVAFAHHYSKGNQAKKNVMDRMSGAGVFARDADSLLMMTDHEVPDTYAVHAVLRNHKPLAPFCVTLDHPIMERWEGGDPTKLKGNNVPQKKHFVDDLVKLFKGEEIRRTDLKQRYFEAKLGSEGTFNNLFREARDTGLIEECDNGRKWRKASSQTDEAKIDEEVRIDQRKVQ